MTFEEWVEATRKGPSLEDDATDHAAPSIDAIAYDAFSGGVEEEETQKPETLKNPDPPSPPGPRSLIKKRLSQPSLSK